MQDPIYAAAQVAGQAASAQDLTNGMSRPEAAAIYSQAVKSGRTIAFGTYEWYLHVRGFMDSARGFWDQVEPIPEDENITVTGPRRRRIA